MRDPRFAPGRSTLGCLRAVPLARIPTAMRAFTKGAELKVTYAWKYENTLVETTTKG